MEEFSLADLADLNVDEIKEVRFSNLPAGIFDFKVTATDLTEGMNKDDEKRYIAEFKFEVLECIAVVDRGVDKESLAGKGHTEKLYIVPAKAEEGIGLIRSFVWDLGCPNKGGLRAIIDGTVGTIFRGKIVQKPDKIDKSVKYSRLVLEARPPEVEAAA